MMLTKFVTRPALMPSQRFAFSTGAAGDIFFQNNFMENKADYSNFTPADMDNQLTDF
jgi:hypothetical protein